MGRKMLLTRKSSKSRMDPPKGFNQPKAHLLNPRTQGMDSNPIAKKLKIHTAFLLFPESSIPQLIIFSNTANTVDNAAKDINRKNRLPQILPPLMCAKMLGNVMKIRLGPAV